jgi:serine/threonine protein kinase
MEKQERMKMIGSDVYSLKGKKVGERFYFKDVFAASSFFVYSLCKDPELTDGGDTLAKVYKLGEGKNVDSIRVSAGYMERAFKLGVSPEFIGLEFCSYDSDFAVLIMAHYGQGALTQLLNNGYYEQHKDDIHKKLRIILDTLYDENMIHNDLHSDNFLYTIDSTGVEFKIIDFDYTGPLGDLRRSYTINNIHHIETEVDGRIIIRRRPDIVVS